MTENAELEDLEQMVNSAGWGRFSQMVSTNWGTPANGAGARFAHAARLAAKSGGRDLENVIFAQDEIQALMQSVPDRIKALKDSAERLRLANTSNAGTSRRGGL
jgi:hypothetical protein